MRVPEAVTGSWSGIRSEVASVFSELYRLMGMMVLLMGAGFLMRKTGIITPEGKKCLTDIILYAILPCNIIKAFSREMEAGFWSTFLMVLLMAVLAQAVSFLLSRLLYRRFDDGEKCVPNGRTRGWSPSTVPR